MKDKYIEISEIFKALGHPTRIRIVEGLIKNECNVMHIVECLNIPQSTVSQHLCILKNSGIIEGERRGNQICYKVINKKIKEVIDKFI